MAVTLVENFRALFYAPFYAAEALGAYKAEGLDVRMTQSTDAARTLTSLSAGGGDIVWGGPLRIMNALDKDPAGGYVAFCEVVGRDPFYLVGRAPNPEFTPAALAGRSLAVVNEVPTPWICLQFDLKSAGVDVQSIAVTSDRGMAANADALRAGAVDVIQVFQPYAQMLVDEGAGHLWYAAADRGHTSYTTFNTTRGYIARHPEVVHGMTRAMYRTQKWIAAHGPDDLARVIGPYFPDVPGPTLAACCRGYRATGLWNLNPEVHRAGIEWLRDAMLAAGSIRTRFGYEDCVDARFAARVLAEDPPSI